jgi:hypothetical protein
MSESIRDIVDIGLEGVLVILLLTISYKIYKMKCDFSSSCFKKDDNGITIQTHNSGEEESI